MAEEYTLLPDQVQLLVTQEQFEDFCDSRQEAFALAHLLLFKAMLDCTCEIRDVLIQIEDNID